MNVITNCLNVRKYEISKYADQGLDAIKKADGFIDTAKQKF